MNKFEQVKLGSTWFIYILMQELKQKQKNNRTKKYSAVTQIHPNVIFCNKILPLIFTLSLHELK